jgi:hypothetical protein
MSPLLALLALASPVPPDLPFAPWFTARGVAVEIARRGPEPPWIRASAELPADANRVAALLVDFGHYRELFSPALRAADLLDGNSTGTARLHMVWPYPFPYRNRDAVVAYSWERGPEGAITLSWRSDSRPGDPREGVRIDKVAGQTRVEPLTASSCRITYVYLGDLGGKFPAWAQEKAWREEPVQYIRALRRSLGLAEKREEGDTR